MKALRGLAAMAAGGALVYAGSLAAESPALRLQKVELAGATSGKIVVSDVADRGGLKKGANLLELSTEDAARRIETMPWVLNATVERILPSRIRVTIVERRPAVVAMAGATPLLVDTKGVVLEQSEGTGMVRVVDMPLAPLAPGGRIPLRQFAHATRILHSLTPALRTRLLSIRAPSIDRISLNLVNGSEIIYGAAEQMEQKEHAARRLLERYEGQASSIATIDVRVPSRPAVRLKQQAPPPPDR